MHHELRRVHERVVDVAARVRERDRLVRHLRAVQGELEVRRADLRRLRGALRDEEQDVKRLEDWTLEWVWASISGERDERLKDERADVVAVKVRISEQEKLVARTEAYVAEVEAALAPFAGVSDEYAEFANLKVAWLRNLDPARAERVDALGQAVVNAQGWVRELAEAVHAGQHVQNHLEQARRILVSVVDDPPPRSPTAGASALAHLRHAHGWIDRFRVELADVGQALPQWVSVRLFPASIFKSSIEDFHYMHRGFERQVEASLTSILAARVPANQALQYITDLQPQAGRNLDDAWSAYQAEVEA